MRDTAFNLPASKVPRLVTVHTRQSDGSLKEKTRSSPAPVFCYSGGGGLFSTAPDYMRFLRALLRSGELDGVHILQADTVALMGRNHIGELEAGRMYTVMPEFSNNFDFCPCSRSGFGLGFLINSEPIPGGRAAGSLAWAGIFNTYFWLDPEQDVCGVLLTQVLPFYDARVVKLFKDFELAVYNRIGN
jgi:CubicO group peptidase (beta-lactamase class C family)